MPRYYFIVHFSDHKLSDDGGTLLPHDIAARDYALQVIRELKKDDGGYDGPSVTMIVKDERERELLVIPFADVAMLQ